MPQEPWAVCHTRAPSPPPRAYTSPSRAGKERAGKGFAARATLLNHWTLTFVPEDHNLELRALRERAVVHQPLRVSQAPGSVALELKQKAELNAFKKLVLLTYFDQIPTRTPHSPS